MNPISATDYRKMAKPKRKHKFNARKVEIDGIVFDSAREAKRYSALRLRQEAGEISNLELQPEFKLAVNGRPVLIRSKGFPKGRQAKYRADFAYWDGEKRVVEDSKGFRTAEFKLKKAIVEAMFPAVRIEEV